MAAAQARRGRSGTVPVARQRIGRASITALHQLLLLRHAKSAWDDARLSDYERPLSPRGRRAANAMRGAMRAAGLAPDIVLVSSARRTLETLQALEPWDHAPLIEPIDALYEAPARRLLRVLNGVAETAHSVLLIGHNPGMYELALALVGPDALEQGSAETRRLAEGFPTAALAEFAVAGSWRGLGEGGGRLLRFLKPKDLPEAAS
jgi:phosphohistidine phosphatase